MIAERLQTIYQLQLEQFGYTHAYGSHLLPLLRQLEQQAGNDLFEALAWQFKPKNHYLVKHGAFADRIYLLLDGYAAEFVKEEEREVLIHFYHPGEFIANYASALNNQRSNVQIRLMENAEFFCIEWKKLKELEQRFPVISELNKIVLSAILEQYRYHALNLQKGKAMQRYQRFCRRYPMLHRQSALGAVADYLGILISSLSRIRRQK